MRLAVTSKKFDKTFKDETNVRVNDIEQVLENRIKKLTEVTYYDDLQIEKESIDIIGPKLLYNCSWRYGNLICLDFATKELDGRTCGYYNVCDYKYDYCNYDVGIFSHWRHNLSLQHTMAFNTYSPDYLAMSKLGIWMVFYKSGDVCMIPQPRTICSQDIYRGLCIGIGWPSSVAVNCLFIL